MATRIRLQRHGRKSYAFYSIVIADVRAPRDGKFTWKDWYLQSQHQPCNSRPQLWARPSLGRVRCTTHRHCSQHPFWRRYSPHEAPPRWCEKGAFDEAAAQSKFEAWKQEKENKSAALVGKLAEAKKSALAARLEAEKAANAKVAEKVAEKKAAAAQAAAEAAEEEQVEEAPAAEAAEETAEA